MYVIVAGLALVLAGCGAPDRSGSADPYADPGTPPPAPIENPTVVPSFMPSAPDANDLVTLNVAGMSTGTGDLSSLALESAFTVVEDGVVKGITVEEIGDGTRAAADIAFVLDTTGSMSFAIDSVKDSIIAFADFLDDSGLDVRLGSITYGDAFDTYTVGSGNLGESLNGDAPPSFDSFARPSLTLTGDLGAFQAFIADQSARGGAGPAENGLGAVAFARQALDWRAGAQCIIIAITDVYSWSEVNPGDGIPADSRWHPPAATDVIADLKGNCTVHVLSPEFGYELSDDVFDMADLTGAAGTGGTFVPFDSFDTFDLTTLPISGVLASGHLVTYRATVDGGEHEVRLVVDDGELRGETTRSLRY